jgi:hypothetical protein
LELLLAALAPSSDSGTFGSFRAPKSVAAVGRIGLTAAGVSEIANKIAPLLEIQQWIS